MQMETTYSLILQIFAAGHWRDAMRLEFSEPEKGFDGRCRAGDINWRGVCDALAEIIDPEQSFERLRQDAEHLRALPDILVAGGLPTATLNHPSIPLGKLDMRLKQWGLK